MWSPLTYLANTPEGTPAQITKMKGQEKCYQNSLKKSGFFAFCIKLIQTYPNSTSKPHAAIAVAHFTNPTMNANRVVAPKRYLTNI